MDMSLRVLETVEKGEEEKTKIINNYTEKAFVITLSWNVRNFDH